MNPRAAAYVTYAQWVLAFFVIVCIGLHPGFVLKRDEGGFSNYGIHIKTAISYTLAYLLCAVFTFLAARSMPQDSALERRLRRVLWAYVALLLLLLFSTYGYSLNAPLKDIHGAIGLVAMVFDPAVALWIYRQIRPSTWDHALLGVEFIGLVLGVIDLFNVAHVLFASQATIAFGFGFLLVRGVHYVTVRSPVREP